MRYLIGGLIAGLLLSLSLSAQSAVPARYLKCVLFVGENMDIRMATVTNPAMTSIEFEKTGDVTFTASAVYDLVNVYGKVNGVTVGNSAKNAASLDVFSERREPVSLSCELVDQTPF